MRWIILFTIMVFILGCESRQETQQATSGKGAAGLTYHAPEAWISEKPSSMMRRAQFRLPGVGEKGDAELAVFVFRGGGGSVQANIDRWAKQFKTPGGSSDPVKPELKTYEQNGLKITLVFLQGTYLQSMNRQAMSGPVEEFPGYAMLGAIVENLPDPWFFKTTGPRETIDHWRDSFIKFIETVRKG